MKPTMQINNIYHFELHSAVECENSERSTDQPWRVLDYKGCDEVEVRLIFR